MVYLYIVNFNLDTNDNVRQKVKMSSGTSLQTKMYHVTIAIDVW